MRDKDRIPKILERLSAVWKKHPDLRLGQLIGNVIAGDSMYYAEDAELIEAIEKFYSGLDILTRGRNE